MLWKASDRNLRQALEAAAAYTAGGDGVSCHLQLAPEIRTELVAMGAATINRALHEVRDKPNSGSGRRRPSSALRRSVPVRTFADWQVPQPGLAGAGVLTELVASNLDEAMVSGYGNIL